MKIPPTTFEEYKSKTKSRLLIARKNKIENASKVLTDEYSIKARIYISFLEYLNSSYKEFFESNCSSLSSSALLRKTLEQLIIARLINIEPDYYLKFFFGWVLSTEGHITKHHDRLLREINLLKKLEEKENELIQNLSKEKISKKSIKELMDLADDEASMTINLHFDNVETLGYGFLSHLLETQKLPYYQNELDDIKKRKDEIAKTLIKQEFFTSKFKTKQMSQVFKLLKDTRSWSEKAETTGFEKEYELLYNFTSKIIHFGSYSVFTEYELQENEKIMFANYFYQYVVKILDEIDLMTT